MKDTERNAELFAQFVDEQIDGIKPEPEENRPAPLGDYCMKGPGTREDYLAGLLYNALFS